jgi:hypothetical protein
VWVSRVPGIISRAKTSELESNLLQFPPVFVCLEDSREASLSVLFLFDVLSLRI